MLSARLCGFLIRALVPTVAGLSGALGVAASQQYVFNRLDFPTGNRPSGVAIADVNGDGRQDLIVVNQSDGTVSVLLAKPDGTFSSKTDFSAGTAPYAIVVADFNEDGKIDIAVTNICGQSCGNISVLLGNGDGTFKAPVSYPTGLGPLGMVAADFNHDGHMATCTVTPTPAALVVACGGGTNEGGGSTGTPAGNYSLTVTGTATSNGATLQHSAKLTLIVN